MIRVRPTKWAYEGLLKRMQTAAARGVNQLAEQVEEDARQNIINPDTTGQDGLSNQGYLQGQAAPRQYPHNASGNLIGKLSIDSAKPGAAPQATVESGATYSYDLNYGTPPGDSTVTAEDILMWAESKSIDDNNGNVPTLAWAKNVVRRIKSRGMAGTWFWTSAVNDAKRTFVKVMKEEIFRG